MSETNGAAVVQPIAAVRFTRRWQHFTRDDIAAFPLEMARGLVAQRVAEPLPPPVMPEPETAAPTPQRSPPATVKK